MKSIMTKDEYNYLLHSLVSTLANVNKNDSIESRYYQKGIINTLKDILSKCTYYDYKEDLKKIIKNEYYL